MGGVGEVREELLDIAEKLPIQRLIRQQENASVLAGELRESWRGSGYVDAEPAVANLIQIHPDLGAAITALDQGAELLRDYAAWL